MKLYLENLIQRFINFSYDIDEIELLLEKPWVLIDEEKNYQKYIFKRDNSLIMSLNGKVQIGQWEYLNSAKSILIDRVEDKILLNQFYFDKSVMILKPDGFSKDYFVLANEILLPDLNIEKYFRNLEKDKFNIYSERLATGQNMQIYLEDKSKPRIGMKATLNGNHIEYDLLRNTNDELYEIQDGRIIKITYKNVYKLNNYELIIFQKYVDRISTGDLAYIQNKPAPNGKYKIGFMNNVKIENGSIIKISIF